MEQSSKFGDQVRNLFKGININAKAFWQVIDDPKNVAHYCHSILHYILETDKKQTIKINSQRLLSTLLVLEFYKNKKPKNKNVLDEIKNLVGKSYIRGHSKWILQFYSKYFKDDQIIQSLISQWTLYPFQNHQESTQNNSSDPGQKIIDEIDLMPISNPNSQSEVKYFQVLKNIHHLSAPIYESNVLSLSYVCFLDHIRGQGNCLDIKTYRHLCDVFIAHVHALRQYQKTQKYLLITIHLIEAIITFYGCPSTEILKDLILWANQLRNTPQFYGNIGQELFTFLHKELKIKGNGFRQKLKMDFPSLDIKNMNRINKEFYIISEMKGDIFNRPEHCSISTLRKLIIMHILKVSQANAESITQYKQLVESLNEAMTFKLYSKLIKLLDIINDLEVYNTITKTLKESVEKLMEQTMAEFKSQTSEASRLDIQDFSQMYHDGNPLGITEYPVYQVINVHIDEFLNPKSQYWFSHIAKKKAMQEPQLNLDHNKIPIIFYGNGVTFSKLLRVFAQYYLNTNAQNSKGFQIYYIPLHDIQNRCGIAIYLASIDLWYKRFVYSSFRQSLLFPQIEILPKNKDLLPSYILNKTLQMYLRQANKSLQMKVFKCHLIFAKKEDEEKRSQQTVYFCSYMLMGASAEAEILKKRKEKQKDKEEKYSKMEYIEILTQKIKKPQQMYLNMKAVCYNWVTKETEVNVQSDLKVDDIQILNIPRDYFMGRAPNPTSIYLEMTVLLDHYAKKFRKEVLNKNNFKKIPESEIVQAFKDLFVSLTLQQIEITMSRSQFPFNVLIDGQQYKYIEKLTVSPALTIDQTPVSVPIMAFLPCQLPG